MSDSQALATQDTRVVKKTEEIFEISLLDELLLSQKQAACFLELAYLALRDDPDIAGQVRSTANDSQNQHLKTHGLVKEYQGTALHVVNTMLPLIELGIKKQKEMLVKKGLDKVLTYVGDMIEKTKDTIHEYYKIKTDVNNEISNIGKKNKDIKKRENEISVEMKEKQLKIESEREEWTKIETKTQREERDLKHLQSKRADFIAKSVQSYGAMEGIKDLFTTGMGFFLTIASPEKGKTMFEGARKATIDRKEQASKQALKASEETKKDIDKTQQMIEENEKRISRMKQEAIESLAAMEKLALEKADLMNEESLKQAGVELGKVEELFGKVLLFWEEFQAKLSALAKSHDGIELLIEFMNDPDLAQDIDDEVGHVKVTWNAFGLMCTKYVEESVKQLPDLYAFMSTPADQVAVEECNRRKKELLEQHRNEIKALENKVIKH